MLPIKKIYIDSRFKTSDSASQTDFKIDLPSTLYLPDNTGLFITDISIPVSWYTIDSGRNNLFYFGVAVGIGNQQVFTGSIAPGNYTITTLASAISDAMNSKSTALSIGVFTITPYIAQNKITITNNLYPFKLFTDEELPGIANFTAPYNSMNRVLQNITVSNTMSLSFTSGFLDLHPIRNLYLVSPNLGTFDTLNVTGEMNVIKKIPVNANYNEMVYDQVVLSYDYVDVSKQTMKRLEFQLKDIYGSVIDLKGDHWSFSLLFAKIPEHHGH